MTHAPDTQPVDVTGALVLFNNDQTQYEESIKSFLRGCNGPLVVVDNSQEPLKSDFFSHPRVQHIHTGANLGFGKGHNLAFSRRPVNAPLHLILNPDVRFDAQVIPSLASTLSSIPDAGLIMPQIRYPDGSIQHLCKLLPTPLDLIFRRFIPSKFIKERLNQRYELHRLSQSKCTIVPNLSGCFLLLKSSAFEKSSGFDPRYFMYMEDVDLIRRIGDEFKTVYDPSIHVVHEYAKGSYKNPKLLGYHIRSAVAYFNKWGWIFDEKRSARNKMMLDSLTRQLGE